MYVFVSAGVEEVTGEDYNVEEADEGPRPFTALLDTGLKRTSTGSKVFAAMKVCSRTSRPLRPWLCAVSLDGFLFGCR